MDPDYFQRLARYNRWANARVFEAVATLDDAAYRQDRGAFFGSLHGTLNHLVVADRIWLYRLTGRGETYDRLDLIPYSDFGELREARAGVDQRFLDLTASYDAAVIAAPFEYANMAGQPFAYPLAAVLGHVFNHQTHHRGQVHAMISQSGMTPPSLDLIYFLAEDPGA